MFNLLTASHRRFDSISHLRSTFVCRIHHHYVRYSTKCNLEWRDGHRAVEKRRNPVGEKVEMEKHRIRFRTFLHFLVLALQPAKHKVKDGALSLSRINGHQPPPTNPFIICTLFSRNIFVRLLKEEIFNVFLWLFPVPAIQTKLFASFDQRHKNNSNWDQVLLKNKLSFDKKKKVIEIKIPRYLYCYDDNFFSFFSASTFHVWRKRERTWRAWITASRLRDRYINWNKCRCIHWFTILFLIFQVWTVV